MKTWKWREWINGMIILPENTEEWVKYGTALIVALAVRYGLTLDEFSTLVVGLIIKALADRVHFWLKYDN
jgi:hypothetical protein